MKLTSTKGWTIKRVFGYGKPRIHQYYTSSTRRASIESIRHNLFYKYTWKQLKAMGYSAIKVEIKEIK